MRKIKRSYLLALPALLMFVACNNQGFKKTKSGLLYKIISDQKKPVARPGQFMKVNFIEKIQDSVLFNSYGSVPAYVRVDSVASPYSAGEIFHLLREGDSAVVVQLADSIQSKFGQRLPPPLKKRDKIFLNFRVLKVFFTQNLMLKDRDNEMEIQKQKEIKAVEDYLSSHHITTQKTPLGAYIEVKTPGDGPAADSGKLVSVLYTGRTIPEGKVFETNINTPGRGPIKFIVGRRQMIPGWDDGIRLFKKGGKGTLYLPAFLAYDAQPVPENKPYANLMFDIEVVDVTDAPKQPERPTFIPPSQKPLSSRPNSQAQPKKTK